jgi:hypothetical protein
LSAIVILYMTLNFCGGLKLNCIMYRYLPDSCEFHVHEILYCCFRENLKKLVVLRQWLYSEGAKFVVSGLSEMILITKAVKPGLYEGISVLG